MFNVDLKRPNCPSARRAWAVSAIGRDIGMLSGMSASLNDLLNGNYSTTRLLYLCCYFSLCFIVFCALCFCLVISYIFSCARMLSL